ncbi:MAG TPA: heme exporter protein CcmD [Steroidobacteraceae bacterium]|jgi:heme exporter protein CcmD
MSAFASLGEFFAMSGYGKYVWPCMVLGFGVVLLNAWLAVRSLADARRDAKRRLEMNP